MNSKVRAMTYVAIGLISGLVLSARLGCAPETRAQTNQQVLSKSSETGEPVDFYNNPFAKVVQDIEPCVVKVSSEKKMPGFHKEFKFGPGDPFEKFFGPFFEFGVPDMPKFAEGVGSGFIYQKTSDGYLVMTNNHVVDGADKLKITLYDGTEIDDVEIVGTDAPTDIAVLKIKTKKQLSVAKLGNSDEVHVGDWAIAVGSPFGLSATVTVGVISALHRAQLNLPEGPDYQDFIQTDAAINPGNSGGPLANIHGEIIGVNTAIASNTGAFAGIGFAVPINLAKSVAEQLVSKGKVSRGYIGVNIQPVSSEIAEAYGLDRPYGALVSNVRPGTPAEKAGLKEGDLIIAFNGTEVRDVNHLRAMTAHQKPGTKVKLRIIRDGKKKDITLKLAELKPEDIASNKPRQESQTQSERTGKWLGISVRQTDQGVVVSDIEEDSPALDAGLRKQDVILKIGNKQINTVDDFNAAAKKYKTSKKPVLFYIQRNDAKLFVAVKP